MTETRHDKVAICGSFLDGKEVFCGHESRFYAVESLLTEEEKAVRDEVRDFVA